MSAVGIVPIDVPHVPFCSNSSTDADLQVDISVGGGAADTCNPAGAANAVVVIPVQTTVWLDALLQCPDTDGAYDPGTDTLILSVAQILDLTTDSTSADFQDLDADGCCIAGMGPASHLNPCTPGGPGPHTATGTCLNLAGLDSAGTDATTVAAGPIGSNTSPLYDMTFKVSLPNEISTSGPFSGAVCGDPPAINFAGTATRCINAP